MAVILISGGTGLVGKALNEDQKLAVSKYDEVNLSTDVS